MKCRCPIHSAFRWADYPRDSIFMDGKLTIGAASGKTQSQISTEAVERITRETGMSPGTIRGAAFSDAAKRATEERQYQRRAKAGEGR